ncbi:hypothetical protein [Zavarzinella formosa]|uniref:hypothetical protein n=1 Tax=Zavarzinella formosa TaxID=360055 RepID=UPI001EE65C31|nr:hypothetical protein [Zavarzinella formosa]
MRHKWRIGLPVRGGSAPGGAVKRLDGLHDETPVRQKLNEIVPQIGKPGKKYRDGNRFAAILGPHVFQNGLVEPPFMIGAVGVGDDPPACQKLDEAIPQLRVPVQKFLDGKRIAPVLGPHVFQNRGVELIFVISSMIGRGHSTTP